MKEENKILLTKLRSETWALLSEDDMELLRDLEEQEEDEGKKKCKNYEECGSFVKGGSWCKECYYEYHETKEELGG